MKQDPVLQQDLQSLVQSFPLLDDLKNTTVLITGASGLIGSQVVRFLALANREKQANIRILAFVRNEQKAKDLFADCMSDNIALVVGDINQPVHVSEPVDYIVHGASATSSRFFVTNPVETIFTAMDGTRNILEFAREKAVKGMVYMSSLEVYGVPSTDGLVGETDYGYIDPLSVRSSYSEGKRMVECLCASYASEYGVPVTVARLSQTFGAGVSYEDGRVFAEFARCAIEKKDIVLHTMGNTVRSYCYSKDAVSALMTILLKGEVGQAYNVTNMDTVCSIKEMAQLVCDTFPESGIEVVIDLPKDVASFGYNPEMVIKMDSRKLQALGWEPTVDLQEMFRRLVESMKQNKQ